MAGFEAAWPRSTLHACWWCCHPFDGTPVGLPLRMSCGVFHCTGIFCSLECALAYNRRERRGFDAEDSSNNLQLMARRMGRVKPLRPAPDRCMLRLFGGAMGVDEFRAAHGEDAHICLHTPPMHAVVPAVEEISSATGGTRRPDQRIPLDLARIRRAERQTSTRRGGAAKNTLEAAMPNLKVGPSGAGPSSLATASTTGSALDF